MLLQDLIVNFRRQVSDEDAPYLWPDEEALLFAIDAQDTFVRKIGGLSDYSTTALTDVTVTIAATLASISPYILRIRSAKLLTAVRDLKIISEGDLEMQQVQDYGWSTPGYLDDTQTGPVTAMVLGIEENKVRWYKVPTATDTCRMHIYRLPYPRITDQEDTLEIPEHHHYHLLKWMKHLAYSKEDAETYDKDLAVRNEEAFTKYCADARAEYDRKRFKFRQIHYGGI